MNLKDEIKQKVKKTHVSNYYKLWLDYHNYLISLKEKDLKLDDYIKILRMFRSACSEVHENVCRVVSKKLSNKENRILNCPFRDCCAENNKTKTHKLYCEISYAARFKDEKKIKKLINEISDSGLKKFKIIEESW